MIVNLINIITIKITYKPSQNIWLDNKKNDFYLFFFEKKNLKEHLKVLLGASHLQLRI